MVAVVEYVHHTVLIPSVHRITVVLGSVVLKRAATEPTHAHCRSGAFFWDRSTAVLSDDCKVILVANCNRPLKLDDKTAKLFSAISNNK